MFLNSSILLICVNHFVELQNIIKLWNDVEEKSGNKLAQTKIYPLFFGI